MAVPTSLPRHHPAQRLATDLTSRRRLLRQRLWGLWATRQPVAGIERIGAPHLSRRPLSRRSSWHWLRGKAKGVEAAAVINLWAVARVIVEAAPRPLFTLVVPRNFRPDW